MFLAVGLSVFVGTLPQLELLDPQGCVNPLELARELDALLPAEPRLRDQRLAVHVVSAAAAHSLHVTLSGATGAPLLERILQVVATDCSLAPRLIARVVASHLEQRTAPGVEAPIVAAAPENVPGLLQLRSLVEAGLASGLQPRAPRLDIAYGLDLGRSAWPRFTAGLRLGIGAARPVGEGEARLWAVAAVIGTSVDWPVSGDFVLAPGAELSLGAMWAKGSDFDRSRSERLPWAAAAAGVSLYVVDTFRVRLAGEVPFFVATLSSADSKGRREPSVRVLMCAAYVWNSFF